MKILYKVLPFLPYLVVFIDSLYVPSDPDLGWHLKYGQYFFTHGSVLRDNTFSTMMPDFHWANGSWGTDVITYAAYHWGGFFGLTLLSAFIVTLTFFFLAKFAKLHLWDEVFLFPTLLYLETPINNVSFRGQQISLLFIAILFWIIRLHVEGADRSYSREQSASSTSLFSKWLGGRDPLLLTIPLFFLWVNIHEESFLGLALFGLWVFFYFVHSLIEMLIRRVRARVKHPLHPSSCLKVVLAEINVLIIFFAACLVTIINPFGIGIHLDALSHFGNPLLKDIAEYLPSPMFSREWWNQVLVAILFGLGILFLFFSNKLRDTVPFLAVAVVLFCLSFGVLRYSWPAYYLLLPFLAPLTDLIQPDNKKTANVIAVSLLSVLLIIFTVQKVRSYNYINFSWNTYCENKYLHCSEQSAKFLIAHHLTAHVLTLYGWGGWLIWNYPQIKPTIDGRMHLWRDADGYSGFADYYSYEQNEKDIDRSNYDVVYMSPDKPIYAHLLTLVKKGKWKLVYQDSDAGIFVRL